MSLSLKRQILKRLIITGIILSVVMLLVVLGAYRTLMEVEQTRTAESVSRLLQSSLENAMLKRDVPGLAEIVMRLGEQPGIRSVLILNPDGEVRFASDPALLNRKMPELAAAVAPRPAGYIRGGDGSLLLRSITSVHNQVQCTQCHGTVASRPINGTLVVDFDASMQVRYAWMGTLLLILSGLSVLIVMGWVAWRTLDSVVLLPVQRLAAAVGLFQAGRLNERVEPDGEGEIASLGHAFNGMADEIQHQIERVNAQERHLQDIIDHLPDGLRVIRLSDHAVVLSNRAMNRQLADEGDTGGIPCYTHSHARKTPCIPTMVICPAATLTQSGQEVKCTHRHVDRLGREFAVEVHAARVDLGPSSGREAYIVESVRDIRQAARISHEQRPSELGFLAAGIAHEIHNPLGSIRLAVQGLARDIRANRSKPEQIVAYLDSIDAEVDNCSAVTRRLLLLSRPPGDTLQIVEVNAVIEDTVRLLDYEAINHSIEQHLVLHPGGIQVLADDSELRMVFLNLIQNAHHAMPEGGEVLISTGIEGDFSVIRIVDSGVGIASDHLEKVFDPFYSARADGSAGTGLGLTIVKSIVESLKGAVEVSSKLGTGTTFTVKLPLAESAIRKPC